MEQEFLPKEIKTYPEAASLQNFTAFGFNAETGKGENLRGRVIQQAIDNVRLQLASVSSASWTGAATATIDLDKLTDFGEIPAAVTGLTVSVPAASSPFVSQAAFQFSLASNTLFASVAINLDSTACKIANAPNTWESGKIYQVTMVNGCAVVGVFE